MEMDVQWVDDFGWGVEPACGLPSTGYSPGTGCGGDGDNGDDGGDGDGVPRCCSHYHWLG